MGTKQKLIEEEIKGNVIPFAKPDGKGIDIPWLLSLKDGTVFLTREKNDVNSFVLLEFQRVGRKNNFILLGSEGMQMSWVDPERFCKRYELMEILGNVSDNKNKGDTTNGNNHPPGSGSRKDNE